MRFTLEMATIREIARQLGVSPSAVSLALKGTGRVSPEKRERIRAAAKAMGYQPHPMVSKALSLVRQPAAFRYRETMAFILEWPLQSEPGGSRAFFDPAFDRARSLGYNLEPFVVSNKASDHRKLSRILRARGIRGLIIHYRLGTQRPRLSFEWQYFAAVEIGRSVWHPRNLHRVEMGDYHQTIEALHLLKKVGYRRIGMAIEPDQNKQARGMFYSTYMFSQITQAERRRIPVLALTGDWGEKTFRRWMEKYQPDVLYVHYLTEILHWLKRMDLKVPRDVSIFCSNVKDAHTSGIIHDCEGMGTAAAELTALLLETGEIGAVDRLRNWQTDVFWQAGETLNYPIGEYLSKDGILRPAQ